MAQLTYNYFGAKGSAGGIVDLAPYAIDTFLNEEANGVLKHGVGVVTGTKAGVDVKRPVAASTAATFEGITVNNRTTEYDLDGNLAVRNKAAIGVMRYGRVYARVATGATPEYGDKVYLIPTGDEAGYVTDAADNGKSGDAKVSYLAIKGRFLGGVDATVQVAPVELFNQAQEVPAN